MGKIVAYLRASTDKQDLNHQKLEILEFARKKEIHIDEFVEITISSRKTSKQRRIGLAGAFEQKLTVLDLIR
jgi:DNA invertase Pin-like site-specific DNA recombinase